ncbi:hypothetical protein C1645_218950 [Glomus cerebriforme]|uniref:Uncharacterized protein n=1 Tax=Glomus cerebriforme TaxID=658196 RepID=A0A397ST85_9GLOM|nr:hypothetical protein C1645_218950 [Glomus cerebriforme]
MVFFICSTYIVMINLLIIAIKWPLDYLFFKAQNLILDSALLIILSRIYLHTYYYIKDQKPLLPQTVEAAEEGGDQENKEEIITKKLKYITHPNQVFLLPLAAFVHILGNIVSYLLINNIIGNIVFLLSNAIAFSMYSFYIYLDTHYATNRFKSKNIVLPHTTTWKLVFIFSWATIFSATVVRVIILKKGI